MDKGLVRNDLQLNLREFILWREKDISGTSGEGVVAEGVVFSDGRVAMRWRTEEASTCVYDSIEAVQKIHGHEGATQVLMLDELDETQVEPEYPPEG